MKRSGMPTFLLSNRDEKILQLHRPEGAPARDLSRDEPLRLSEAFKNRQLPIFPSTCSLIWLSPSVRAEVKTISKEVTTTVAYNWHRCSSLQPMHIKRIMFSCVEVYRVFAVRCRPRIGPMQLLLGLVVDGCKNVSIGSVSESSVHLK